MIRYDLDDTRPMLERASARETAARVAVGALAEVSDVRCSDGEAAARMRTIVR